VLVLGIIAMICMMLIIYHHIKILDSMFRADRIGKRWIPPYGKPGFWGRILAFMIPFLLAVLFAIMLVYMEYYYFPVRVYDGA
jgi:hypothetical protein